ncbi:hypothetical protein, partial [Pelagibacterium mangrovi]|uniref:hypothetical protein n=1 Tax=Pelagibacterium mangrovi TaxID=3119828 RepID=UPI002FC9BE32
RTPLIYAARCAKCSDDGQNVNPLARHTTSHPFETHVRHQRREQKTRPANPQARAALDALSRDILACWRDLGGIHMQIGRKYPYFESRLPNTQKMLQNLKALCDPDAILNPGVVLPVEPDQHATEPAPTNGFS